MFLAFHKYQAAGNDFIFLEDPKGVFLDAQIIRALCHRHYGIGADGLVILKESQSFDLEMHYFNADGKEVAMCGNALRAVFLHLGEAFAEVETAAAVFKGRLVSQFETAVEMHPLEQPPITASLHLDGEDIRYTFVHAYVPHIVVEVDDIDEIDVVKKGRALRYHPTFSKGTNVNFVQKVKSDRLYIRTYERGVEDETLSCGTGAYAAFLACHFEAPTTQIAFRSGESLFFDQTPSSIEMRGEARHVFEGSCDMSALRVRAAVN